MYLVESGQLLDRFIDKLLEVAERGVTAYLLLDDFGARGFTKSDRQRLTHPNIHLQFYNPLHYVHWRRMLFRNHRKLLLVDGRVAFVGGTGLSDHFAPQLRAQYWRDLVVAIEGPCVNDWQQLFFDSWPDESISVLPLPEETVPPDSAQLGRVVISHMSHREEVKRALLKHVNNAEHWVWITTPYFVPSWKIRRALRRAARRSVDVRLVLSGPHTDHPAVRHAGRRFYYRLLKQGVRIFEYQPRFNHGKAYLCDQWCSIGSSNLDRWNMTWNLEGNQEIDDQGFAERLRHLFEEYFEDCVELRFENWRQRPWHRRLLEWFWGRIDIALHQIMLRWRR